MHSVILLLKVECFRFAELVSGQQYAIRLLVVVMQPHQRAGRWDLVEITENRIEFVEDDAVDDGTAKVLVLEKL